MPENSRGAVKGSLGQVTLRLVSVPDRAARLAALGSLVLRAVTAGAKGRRVSPGGDAP